MTEMSYTRLGQSGLVVSRLALGTMTFNLGSDYLPGVAQVGQDAGNEMVAKALDHGVNFFDSADGYSSGEAEIILGKALGARRKDNVICTKLGFRQGPTVTDAGLSRRHIMQSVDGCLTRLDTDYIDLLVLHKTDFTTPMEETLRTLDDAVKAGKLRYIGVSNWPAWQVARAIEFQKQNGLAPFVAGQYLYNAVSRDLEVDVLPMMAEMGAGLMAWSPLAGGLLTGKYDPANLDAGDGRLAEGDFLGTDPEQAKAALGAMQQIAKDRGETVSKVAYAWVLAKSRSHTVICGPSKLAYLEDALGAIGVHLTQAEVAAIDAAATPARRYPEWFDTMMTDEIFTKALA
ncbi:MAG: aldo/keto reductase [Cognatishimia sp.]